jgi:hypothetical protein
MAKRGNERNISGGSCRKVAMSTQELYISVAINVITKLFFNNNLLAPFFEGVGR